ncbi:unnamed protein product, partial [Didymodactylos carnosus]
LAICYECVDLPVLTLSNLSLSLLFIRQISINYQTEDRCVFIVTGNYGYNPDICTSYNTTTLPDLFKNRTIQFPIVHNQNELQCFAMAWYEWFGQGSGIIYLSKQPSSPYFTDGTPLYPAFSISYAQCVALELDYDYKKNGTTGSIISRSCEASYESNYGCDYGTL